jgi:choline dehydrogenase-like flavoprotein
MLKASSEIPNYDIVIIGSGMGGGTLAYALRHSGARIAILERGDYLPRERENWDPENVFIGKRYKTSEMWYDAAGKGFNSGMHYFVGGSTKVYGAALVRFRQQDFATVNHAEGVSPEWPITYGDLEPYYTKAEKLYFVHGTPEGDPGGPPRSEPLPFPNVEHEPYIKDLQNRLTKQGLNPGFLPLAVDVRPNGRCVRCNTCDGFPCLMDAKADTDVCCVRPLVAGQQVDLYTNVRVTHLSTNRSGDRVVTARGTKDGHEFKINAGTFVLSCGAVNSAALLLKSKNPMHPNGLGNSSDMVGRHYMAHLNSAILAVDPFRKNPTVFQKTMVLNDFYFSGPGDRGFPHGSLQLLGKSQSAMLRTAVPSLPRWMADYISGHSVDWWATSEDLPDPDNRVAFTRDEKIQVIWKPKNTTAHEALLRTTRQILLKAGYKAVFLQRMGIAANSHQCGTLRFGGDPRSSVLDTFCKCHDLANLYVVDASFFPSSAAINPALTIAAQALRVGDHLAGVKIERSVANQN